MIAAEDEERLLSLLRGDSKAREAGQRELFELTREGLFGLALRMTGRPDLADDAIGETMLDVIQGLKSFRGEARLTTWLYRVAVRASLRVAARARDRTVELPSGLVSSVSGPAQSAERRDEAERILAAIAGLPPRQRAVVALSALEELPLTEVAAILGVPEGTVHSRLHAARERLLERLA